VSEAAYTHMDIVTILEDAKIDSYPQNDVGLDAAQHVTTTSEQFTIQGKSDTLFFVCLLKMLRMKFLGHHLVK